jgi:hypothetical protein
MRCCIRCRWRAAPRARAPSARERGAPSSSVAQGFVSLSLSLSLLFANRSQCSTLSLSALDAPRSRLCSSLTAAAVWSLTRQRRFRKSLAITSIRTRYGLSVFRHIRSDQVRRSCATLFLGATRSHAFQKACGKVLEQARAPCRQEARPSNCPSLWY